MKMTKRSERGFSLIEMMMVLAILTLVMGVTMKAINDVQKRARTEEAKVDLNQESREFVDQIVRDLHQSGYPTSGMYTTAPGAQSSAYAQGITAGDQTSIQFEGDVDGDGIVDIVNYQLITDATVAPGGQCPCILRRSQVKKINGGPQPAPLYNTEVDQVINSAGGGASWVIAGSFLVQNNPNTTVANDTYYAQYKTHPIFRYFNISGTELVPPIADFTQVKSIRVTVATITRQADPVTGAFQAVSMSASARIANR